MCSGKTVAPRSSVLRTARLTLRDFHADDATTLSEYFSEREAQPNILRAQRRPGLILDYVQSMASYASSVPLSSREQLGLAITLTDTGDLIGMCSLSQARSRGSVARMGWHLSQKFSGRGYATEAASALIGFAFDERGFERVYADCYETNAANRRVFSKLGMQPSPWLPVLKWCLAARYRELRPIVRYSIGNPRSLS